MSLDAFEQELIKNALKQADGNKSMAARLSESPEMRCATG